MHSLKSSYAGNFSPPFDQTLLTIFFSIVISFFSAYFLLFYPGYLNDHSLTECIIGMRFRALICGRAVFLFVALLLFLLYRRAFSLWRSEKTKCFLFLFPASFLCITCYALTFYDSAAVHKVALPLWVLISSFFLGMILYSTVLIVVTPPGLRFRGPLFFSDFSFRAIWVKSRIPFISSIIFGVLAYMWFFTNKILNHDEIRYLFSKGADLSSGRWGLCLTGLIFQNYSVPWLWGVITIILLGISCCIIIDLLGIKNKLLQITLSALIVCFPSETGTMFYMFTSTSYALSFLFCVLSVSLLISGRRNRSYYFIAVFFSVLAVSIYQAYITVISSLMVVLLTIDIVKGEENERRILLKGFSWIAFLGITLIVYYVINLAVMKYTDTTYNNWAMSGMTASDRLPVRVINSFSTFADILINGEYGIVRTLPVKIIHCFLLFYNLLSGFILLQHRSTSAFRTILFICCACILLPLSINGLIILLGETGIHTLTVYGFIAFYCLSAALADLSLTAFQTSLSKIITPLFLIIACANIAYSNKVGLEGTMEYENTYAIYQSAVTQIQSSPGFNAESRIAFIGKLPNSDYKLEFWTTPDVMGVSVFRNASSIRQFISYYLGIDLQYATEQEIDEIKTTAEFYSMPSYPYYGYIHKIGNIFVVKFSD